MARSWEITGGNWAAASEGRLLRVSLAFIIARRYPGRPGLVSPDNVVESYVLRRPDQNGQNKWQNRLDPRNQYAVAFALSFDFIESG